MNKSLVSIIMAAYNALPYLNDAVDSVLAQTYAHWELIIIDDNSNDETWKTALAYAAADTRIKVLKNPKNLGAYQSRKRAIENARGNWIAFLDADDMWTPEKLARQLQAAEDTGRHFLYTGVQYISGGNKKSAWYYTPPVSTDYTSLKRHNVIACSSVLIWADLLRKNLFSDIPKEIHEDYALWLKILKSGEAAQGIPAPMLIYRITASSKTGNKFKSIKMTINTYRFAGISGMALTHCLCANMLTNIIKYHHIRQGLR